MKFRGVSLGGQVSRQVSLVRPDGSEWEMMIRPLRLSFHRTLQSRGIVPPAPPVKASRDSHGQVMRDADGLVLLQKDEQSGSYLEAKERHLQRVAGLIVWECLQEDDRYSFETPVPGESGDWGLFADGIVEELEEAGWTSGDVMWFCDQVAELSHLAGERVRESRASFF